MTLAQRRRRGGRPLLVALGLAVALITPAAPGLAQESLLASVYPESTTLGTPSWVEVGTQVTWSVAAASVAQSRYQWVEDPEGTWEDPKTGKKYRRTDESGESPGGGAGDGYSVLDVVAIEGTDAVGAWTLYGIDRMNAAYTVAGLGGGKVPGAVVDGAWMHPALLARFVETGFGSFQVLRGPYPVGDRVYDVVSLISDDASGYQSWSWDMETGLLVVSTSRQDGAMSPFAAAGESPPQANSFIGHSQLVDVRRRATPGIGAPVPEWVARTPRLAYSGSWTFVNPMDPSSAAMVFPMTTEATIGSGGPTWSTVQFRNVIDMQGFPSTTEGSAIATGVGSWWWDPAALAGMRRGDVLDEVPLLSARVTVEDRVPWQGGESVIIRTELPGNVIRAQYDTVSGVLLGTEMVQRAQGTTMALGLDQLP